MTDVLHLHSQIITVYKGDYDTFERTRDERLRNQQKAHEANERTRAHIQVVHPSCAHLNSCRFSSYYQVLKLLKKSAVRTVEVPVVLLWLFSFLHFPLRLLFWLLFLPVYRISFRDFLFESRRSSTSFGIMPNELLSCNPESR